MEIRGNLMSDRLLTIEGTRYLVGRRVQKTKGYPFPGEIRSVFTNRNGDIRFVVEATHPEYSGMLHIFSPEQLDVANRSLYPTFKDPIWYKKYRIYRDKMGPYQVWTFIHDDYDLDDNRNGYSSHLDEVYELIDEIETT